MKIEMTRAVSGYVWGGIRLPAVGQETDVPDGCAKMLIDSGNAVEAKSAPKAAPVETASVETDAETADAKTATKSRKG